jgi:hypothetical protein
MMSDEFQPFVKLFWHTDCDYDLFHLPDLELGLTVSVTGGREMLTPPRHIVPHLVYPEVRVCSIWDRSLFISCVYFCANES